MPLFTLFDRWFGRRPEKPGAPVRDVAALMAPLGRPSVHLARTRDRSSSHLGGQPDLPEGFVWPATKDGRALGFIAALDLAALAACHQFAWLPDAGRLLFFYDVEEQPWGYDPSHAGAWAVLHVDAVSPGASAPVSPGTGAPPDAPLPPHTISPDPLPSTAALQRVDLRPALVTTFPDEVPQGWTDTEVDAYCEHQDAQFGGRPQHQVGGFAGPVQGAMELECQLVSNGIACGDGSGSRSARAKALEPGAAEWRLLLQVDSDDHADAMWGDAGRLYFWIREEDARARRFDRAWVILQCT